MGLCGKFYSVTPEELKAIELDPDSLPEIAFAKVEEADETQDPSLFLDIDKTWMGIHLILTGFIQGGEYPLANAIYGVKEIKISEEEIFYVNSPKEVHDISNALNQISSEEFIKRYDQDEFKESDVYPDFGEYPEEDLEYMDPYFDELKAFYKLVAGKNQGIVTTIS